jgi:two-component system, sensor histidine kinase LadS
LVNIVSDMRVGDNQLKDCFIDEQSCLKFLAEEKWVNGFECRKCGHTNYCQGKKPFSRRCTRCKAEESATAHTVFHRCKIPLVDAFEMVRLVCSDPGVSSYEISRKADIRQMTCWKFKSKIQECLKDPEKSSGLKRLIASGNKKLPTL